jgi:hypothetical protein
MKLEIEPLSQKDSRWKLKRLGNSSSTIGSYGCLLVCHSMMLRYYGHDLLPDALNELYKQKGVFDGDLINYWKVPLAFPDIQCPPDGFLQCPDVPAPLDVIDSYLDKKMPVIALVDFDKATQGVQGHFVLIIGKDGDYLINDPMANPGEGSYYFSARYGDPAKGIYGLRLYQGPAVIEEDNYKVIYKGQTLATYERNPIDQIDQLSRELEGARTNLAQEVQNVAALQTALTAQEKDNSELMARLRDVEKQRDTVLAELKNLKENACEVLDLDECTPEAFRAVKKGIQWLTDRVKDLSDENKKLLEKVQEDFDYWGIVGNWFLGRWKKELPAKEVKK